MVKFGFFKIARWAIWPVEENLEYSLAARAAEMTDGVLDNSF